MRNDHVDENSTPPTSTWSESLNKVFEKKNPENFDIFNPFGKLNKKKTTNMKHDYRKETQTTMPSRNSARGALDYRKTYLFLYNLVMFTMFLKVITILTIKGLSNSIGDDTISGAAFLMKLLTQAQVLETIHPMIGLVPGGPFMPFIQMLGRLIVCFCLSNTDIRQDSQLSACLLMMVWSSIEIFRYSFYALRVFNVDIYSLTWCRYTFFIPLYPLGGLLESLVIISTIKYYERTKEYSLSLPNSANISISLPIILKLYILLMIFSIYKLMMYMWAQRRKQLKVKVA